MTIKCPQSFILFTVTHKYCILCHSIPSWLCVPPSPSLHYRQYIRGYLHRTSKASHPSLNCLLWGAGQQKVDCRGLGKAGPEGITVYNWSDRSDLKVNNSTDCTVRFQAWSLFQIWVMSICHTISLLLELVLKAFQPYENCCSQPPLKTFKSTDNPVQKWCLKNVTEWTCTVEFVLVHSSPQGVGSICFYFY